MTEENNSKIKRGGLPTSIFIILMSVLLISAVGNAALSMSLLHFRQQTNDLQKELSDISHENYQLRSAISQQQNETSQLLDEASRLRDEISGLQDEVYRLQNEITSRESEVENSQSEAAEVQMAMGKIPNPIVTIEMDDGQIIRLELFHEMAPNTVTNFVYLAQQGFYDGLVFHRLIPEFMIQGGCPEGTGMGGPGHTIRGEFPANGFMQNRLLHTRGVISMARAQPMDSAGSQFFIMHDDSPFLDQAGYAAFGRVIEGMEVVDDIAMDPTTGPPSDTALEPRTMRRVTVETFGFDWGEPEKLQSLR